MYDRLQALPSVRVFVAACFYYSGLVPLLRLWARRPGRRLIILCLHDASGGNLRDQLLYLRRRYRLLSLEAALHELYGPKTKESTDTQSARTPLVVTFDDGYRDNYTHAFALARDLQIPLTIFLVPGYITSGRRFWWLEGEHLVRQARAPVARLGERSFRLDDDKERQALAVLIDARVRYASSVSEREEFLRSVRDVLAVPSPEVRGDDAVLPLSWSEVRKMEESGWISFGAHTLHHPVLACLRDPAEIELEVGACRTVLEQQLGHPVRTFAYPIGRPEHIGDHGLAAVRAAPYEAAVTTLPGINTPRTNPYLLRRVSGNTSDHWLVLAARATGIWSFFFRPRSTTSLHKGSQRRSRPSS